MFFDGDRNSVLVGVWGSSVAFVTEVLDVVLLEVVDLATTDVEVVVGAELGGAPEGEPPLEQAAPRRVSVESARRPITRTCLGVFGIRQGYVRSPRRLVTIGRERAGVGADGDEPVGTRAGRRVPE